MLDLGKTFIQTLERCPNHLAIVDGNLRYSYQQWAQVIGGLQHALKDRGLRKGDRILSILQNRFEAATLHWACQMAGITIVPINWRSKPEEIDYCVNNSRANLVFYEDVSADAFSSSEACRDLSSIYCGDPTGGLKQSQHFAEVMTLVRDPSPEASADDYSLMLYTSGTTGKPKGVPRLHHAERAAAIAHIVQNQYRSGESSLGVMPLYHTMGVRTLLALCIGNGTFVALPKWNTEIALDLIEQEKISHLYLVPTLYHDLIESEKFREDRIHSVKKLGFAGAPMHDGLLIKLNAIFKPELFVNHYGSSEIYTFTVNKDAVAKPGSAGVAGINSRIRVVRFDDQNKTSSCMDVTSVNEEGQIICDLASDEAFSGYWERPDADAKSLRGCWYFTGDTGYVDQEGDLYVTGRVDDMIISGGENISPVEIESVLSLHPAVSEVAVAGISDDRLGQKVVAFVKAKEKINAEALDGYCRTSDLQNFKRPREYVFIKDIPKSPVGKILRRKLVAHEYELAE